VNAIVIGGRVDGGKIFGAYLDLTLDGPDDMGRGGRCQPNSANFWDPNSIVMPPGFVLP